MVYVHNLYEKVAAVIVNNIVIIVIVNNYKQ